MNSHKLALVLALLALPAWAGPDAARASLSKGLKWLAGQQNSNGSFGKIPGAAIEGDVGITGLVIKAVMECPEDLRKPYQAQLDRAVAYIVSQARADGAIGDPAAGLGNYRTSMAILALSAVDREKHKDMISKAKDFILGLQFHEGTGVAKDNPHFGGFGYDKTNTKPDADLSNTQYALEALKEAGLPEDSEAYKRVLVFLQRCQDAETNDSPKLKVTGSGGFFYDPALSRDKSELTENPDGSVSVATYSSMTYAGLKSLIYAGLAKDDPRVQAALDWITAHYTLEENYGLGTRSDPKASKQGLYYYYATFARCMEVFGEDILVTDDGQERRWARELADKMVELQNPEGFWVNEVSRWWERDPVLVSAYSIQALGIALRHWD